MIKDNEEHIPHVKEVMKCHFCHRKGHKVSSCRYRERARKISKEAHEKQKEKSDDNFKKFMTEKMQKLYEIVKDPNKSSNITINEKEKNKQFKIEKEINLLHAKLDKCLKVVDNICEKLLILQIKNTTDSQEQKDSNDMLRKQQKIKKKAEVVKHEEEVTNEDECWLYKLVMDEKEGKVKVVSIEHSDLHIGNKASFKCQKESGLDPRRCLYYYDKNKKLHPYMKDFKTDQKRCERIKETGMRKLDEEEMEWLLNFEKIMKKLKKQKNLLKP